MAQAPFVTLIGQDGLSIASALNPLPMALDTATINVTAVISGSIALAAGTATIGTATINQTTFGDTNRVVAGKTQAVSVTLAMTTTTAYNPNFVAGGLITFANALGTSGSGILQTVDLNVKNAQTNNWLFVPFNGNPSNSTWTDHAVSAINAADVFSARDPVVMSGGYSTLGTSTIYSSPGLGIAMATGSTTLYGILLATSTSAAFSSTSDMQITIKTLQD